MARRSDKKKDTKAARPHPYCPGEWSIDRSGETRDDLDAGSPRACPIRRNLRKRVCDHRIGAHPPLPSPRTAFSFKSSFNQERVFVSRKITSLPAFEYHEDTVFANFIMHKRLTDSVTNKGRTKIMLSHGCLCFGQCTQISWCTLSQIKNITCIIKNNEHLFSSVSKAAEDSVLWILNLFVNDLFLCFHIFEKINKQILLAISAYERNNYRSKRETLDMNTCGINSVFYPGSFLSFISYSRRDTEGRADAGHGWRGEQRARGWRRRAWIRRTSW